MAKKSRIRGSRKAYVFSQMESFETVWNRRNEESVAFLCIDVENWDVVPNSNTILEVGVTIRPAVGSSFTIHYIVKENFHLVNRYCETSPLSFVAGCSSIWLASQAELREVLDSTLSGLQDQHDVVCLTGFMVQSDMKFLSEGLGWVAPSSVEVIDVQALAEGFRGYDNMPSLGMVSSDLKVQVCGDLGHNSGNDAFVTMEVMFAVAQVLSLEAEKEKEKDRDFFEFM
jgi:hypothetical protein